MWWRLKKVYLRALLNFASPGQPSHIQNLIRTHVRVLHFFTQRLTNSELNSERTDQFLIRLRSPGRDQGCFYKALRHAEYSPVSEKNCHISSINCEDADHIQNLL